MTSDAVPKDALPSALQQRKVRDLLEAERWLRQALTDEPVPEPERLDSHMMYADQLPKASESHGERGLTTLWNMFEAGADAVRDLLEPTQMEEEEYIMWTIVLTRTSSKQKWGFKWNTERLLKFEERILESLQPGSIADLWSKQEEERGDVERCLKANDKLVSANGRTEPLEMKNELQKKEVVLEFRRAVPVEDDDEDDEDGESGDDATPEASSPIAPKPEASREASLEQAPEAAAVSEASAASAPLSAQPSSVASVTAAVQEPDTVRADEALPASISPSSQPGLDTGSATSGSIPMFKLSLQLAHERSELFEFQLNANLDQVVDEFMQRINLNTMFRDPLLAHATLMVQTGRHEDTVDVVDLM